MKYGLSLLVCFAMSVCANAQTVCNGDKCSRAEGVVVQSVKGVAHVATAPIRAVAQGCCGSQGSQVSQAPAKQVGPIRQFFRNVFRR